MHAVPLQPLEQKRKSHLLREPVKLQFELRRSSQVLFHPKAWRHVYRILLTAVSEHQSQ